MEGETGVGLVVPHGFDAVLRLMHRLDDGTWADQAAEYLRHGAPSYDYPFPDQLAACEGDLGEEVIDVLAAGACKGDVDARFVPLRAVGGLG